MAADTDTDTRPDHDGTVEVTGRRSLLVAAGTGILAAACTAPPAPAPRPAGTPTTLAPTTTVAPTPVAAARHLANRATFGATAATVDAIRRKGPAAWLDQQLAPASLPDAEARLTSYTTLRQTNAQNDSVRSTDEELLFAELDHATIQRAVYSERQLYEVMCDFWTNHLTVWRRAKWLSQLKTVDNEQVVRRFALGKFADLLMASAKSPAMLVYLDNFASEGQPGSQVNENYGRELLELHTLGIVGGAQVYTEADVVGVAKVLSGWSINWDDNASRYSFRFSEWWHCQEAVSILGGAWSRPSRANYQDRVANAQRDGESLINFLARHPSTARNLASKLAHRFVSDAPPPALVDRLAATYLASDTAIAPVLRQLFLSPEFNAAIGQKVKRPQDWLFSALRTTRAQIHAAPKGMAAARLRTAAFSLGQPLFERVTPDGWPDRATYWVAADGLLKRWEHGAKLARNQLTDAASTEKVVVDVAALLPSPLPATVRDVLVAMASSTFQFDLAAGEADAIATAARLSPTGAASTLTGDTTLLQNAVGLLLSHPAFQRR
jgi:uncharacterized protein (DUF1800 family)